MFAAGLITFRETLEAALVVGIILTFLYKTRQSQFVSYVWRGVVAGIGISLILAVVLDLMFGGLTGAAEQLFEGIIMFVTAIFLTWMILWVHRQKDVGKNLKEKVATHATQGYGLGIFLLAASSIFREGTETVLYLKASSLIGGTGQLVAGMLGIVLALGAGVLVFVWAIRINLSVVFNVTSVFLLLFAAGLVTHGVHEFQMVGLLPVFSFDPIMNISHILNHEGIVGGILRTLFGYTSKPTVLEATAYGGYILFIFWLKRTTDNLLAKAR